MGIIDDFFPFYVPELFFEKHFQLRENLEESEIDFMGVPMAEILVCAGFFLIYFIEECVHFFLPSGEYHHNCETIPVHRSFRYDDCPLEKKYQVSISMNFKVLQVHYVFKCNELAFPLIRIDNSPSSSFSITPKS